MYFKQIVGKDGEYYASKYLLKIGYEIIERNFSCKSGEIDIICFDEKENEYVFVEVKTRTNYKYGNPAEAVDKNKQKHIWKATNYYAYKNDLENKNIRFDIIEVYEKDKIYINHLKNCEIEG